MKKTIEILAISAICAACTANQEVVLSVTNPSSFDRIAEVVEIPVDRLNLSVKEGITIKESTGKIIPYQFTYDGKLVFLATVKASSNTTYTISSGLEGNADTIACGAYYKERLDDIAWENDKMAYRAYGPALQKSGEKAFGYDILTKSVPYPVLKERYRMELDKNARNQIKKYRESGQKEKADSLALAISYHVDHGNGMDCYNVGPTLGGGTAALLSDSAIIYPYCYTDYKILDNGPLRFTVELTYPQFQLGKDSAVVETRLIQLDAGTYLNKTTVEYKHLSISSPLGVGIVLHSQNPDGATYNKTEGYIAYADSTNNTKIGNGVIYVGAVFPSLLEECGIKRFTEKEIAVRGGALGHVMGITQYNPGDKFEYYWGAAWSKSSFESMKDWEYYLKNSRLKLNEPLIVTLNN